MKKNPTERIDVNIATILGSIIALMREAISFVKSVDVVDLWKKDN